MPRLLLALPLIAAVAACSDNPPPPPDGTEVSAQGEVTAPAPLATPAALPSASGPGTAFGLTRNQIEDADLVDVTGRELGEVDRIDTDASGEVTGVIVKIADTDPDRRVLIPIARLSAVADGDDWDLRAATSRDELMQLPQVDR